MIASNQPEARPDWRTLDDWRMQHSLRDVDVEWWAVALLDLKPKSLEWRVRRLMQEGRTTHLNSAVFWQTWGDVVARARTTVMTKTRDEWLELAARDTEGGTNEPGPVCKIVRDAALSSPRAFVEFADLRDEEDHAIKLREFQVLTVNDMRQGNPVELLLPYGHGKSYLSSIVVPLMDWAEWAAATEGRIYWSDSHVGKWIARLKREVEYNSRLHQLWPWIRRPRKGDAGQRWAARAFCIGGSGITDPSFEALTAKTYATGNRYARVGDDDWVTTGNATMEGEQDKLLEYFFTGPMTMRQELTRPSRFGTAWPGIYHVGTLFNPGDVNYRLRERFEELGHRVRRFDVYTHGAGHPEYVIWPEVKTPEKVRAMREDMGWKVFSMRCRNMVYIEGTQSFPRALVIAAEHDGQDGKPVAQWGAVPSRTRVIIGFDPAAGKKTKAAKNPAIVLYGEEDRGIPPLTGPLSDPSRRNYQPDFYHHFIKWAALAGLPFTKQCEVMVDWARGYGCPIAFEDNNQQIAYGEYIAKIAPDVRLISHTTGENKRDADDGVEQFVPLFENGRIIIHAAGAPQDELKGLRTEFTTWGRGRFSDRVMAFWIARYQYNLGRPKEQDIQLIRPVPWYVARSLGRAALPRGGYGSYPGR